MSLCDGLHDRGQLPLNANVAHKRLAYLKFCNGDRYYGPVNSKNVPDGGHGITFYRDGSVFVGSVRNGSRCGQGTFLHAPTDVQYDGKWKDDLWHGEGCLYSIRDGSILSGTWKIGELDGEGIRTDLFTGVTWSETYSHGRLISYKLIKVDESDSESHSVTSASEYDSFQEESVTNSTDPTATSFKPKLENGKPGSATYSNSPSLATRSTSKIEEHKQLLKRHYEKAQVFTKVSTPRLNGDTSMNRSGLVGEEKVHWQRSIELQSNDFAIKGPSNTRSTSNSRSARIPLSGCQSIQKYCRKRGEISNNNRDGEREGAGQQDNDDQQQASLIPKKMTLLSRLSSRGSLPVATTVSKCPPLEKPVRNWDVDDVADWLVTIKTSRNIISQFISHQINGEKLVTLTRESLRRELNIIPFGLRTKLEQEIRALRQREALITAARSPRAPIVTGLGGYTFTNRNSFVCSPNEPSGDAELKSCCETFCNSITSNGIAPYFSPRQNTAATTTGSSSHHQLIDNDKNMNINIPPLITCREAPQDVVVCNWIDKIPSCFIIDFKQLEFLDLISQDEASSSVFRGRWLGKEVAIKVFTGYLIRPDLWIEYVQTISDVRHPNVALVLGVSVREPIIYCVVSEYIPNGALSEYLHGSTLQESFQMGNTSTKPDYACRCAATPMLSWLPFGFKTKAHHSGWKPSSPDARYSLEITKQGSDTSGSFVPIDSAVARFNKNGEEWEGPLPALGGLSRCSHQSPYLNFLFPELSSENEYGIRISTNRQQAISSARSQNVPIAMQAVIYVARGIALGCAYLRQKGISNINLKPSNVLLDESFNAKLTDYAIGSLVRAFSPAPLTSTPTIITCPNCKVEFDAAKIPCVMPTIARPRRLNWLAPEFLRIPSCYLGGGSAGDIYSYALIFWEMLSNYVPFAGLSPTQIRGAVGFGAFRVPDIRAPQPMKHFIELCSNFIPENRLQTFESILFHLANFHLSASSFAEDALATFMHGAYGF